MLDGVRTEEITRRRHAVLSHFNIPVAAVKNQTKEVDPLLKRKLKVYGRESAHTFVDQLFGGQLLSTIICESCHQPYQILEPFMDLSLPVSEDKSPPVKRGKSDPIACLAPSSPAPVSKHQLKKERMAARKGKGKGSKQGAKAAVGDEEAISTLQEEDKEVVGEPSATSTPMDENPSSEIGAAEQRSSASSIKDEDRESSASSGREDREDDEEDGGDVEDNNEEPEKDLEDLNAKMRQMHVDSVKEDDSVSQHTMDSCSNPPSATTKRIRSEWVAKSICSLTVRYQATNQECSVQSCLNLFTAPEFLTGPNKYGCENCTRRKAAAALAEGTAVEGAKTPTVYSVASKQLLIFAPPAILTLHLKRFTQNGATLRKAQKHVDFPLLLDLAPFCSGASAGVGSVPAGQTQVLYSLYGVIEHSGRLSQGHYTAFVKVRAVDSQSVTQFLQRLPMQTDDLYRLRDQLSSRLLADPATSNGPAEDASSSSSPRESSEGVWYHCSDSHVMPVSEDKVLRSQAFLLFYERVL